MSANYNVVGGDGASTEVQYTGGGLTLAVPGEPNDPPNGWDEEELADHDDDADYYSIFEFAPDGPDSYECFYGREADLAIALATEGMDQADVIASVIMAMELWDQGYSTLDVVQAFNRHDRAITNANLTIRQIICEILAKNKLWPRAVGGTLFVDDPERGVCYFDRHATDSFFGWLRSRHAVVWKDSGAGRGEVVAELERTAERYDAVELLPHEPLIPNIYYRGKVPQAGAGNRLEQLIKRFKPDTTVDSDLIKAAFMTPMWGGPAGKRPIITVTSDAGRGVGKSTLVEIISYLYGGHFDVSCGSDIEKLKTRMLSADARSKRLALIDNVKTMKMSWAELEAMTTAPVISGHQMWRGEGQRPNLICWFVTVNGPAMAPDLAQRSVIIKLAKADYSGTWLDETYKFIDKHRSEIIADIIGALRAEKFPLQKFSRWGPWEADVLQRLPKPGEAQKLILERQALANVELDEVEAIEDFIATELERLGYEPDTDEIRIPTAIVADWYRKATNDFKIGNVAVGRRLGQMIGEGQIHWLSKDPCHKHGRAFFWTGANWDLFTDRKDDLLERIESHRFSSGWGNR